MEEWLRFKRYIQSSHLVIGVEEYAWQLRDDQTIKAAISAALRDDYLSNYEFEEIRILVDNASKQKIKRAINAN